MNNPDTNNTGYTIHITKVRENIIGNQVWTIQTPKTLGKQYTEQRKPKGQSRIKNPDTDNTVYTIHITKVRENGTCNQE